MKLRTSIILGRRREFELGFDGHIVPPSSVKPLPLRRVTPAGLASPTNQSAPAKLFDPKGMDL